MRTAKLTRRILLVDDHLTLALTLGKILELQGYAVTTAASGEEALEALQQDRPDIVLSDVKMPGMSGLELMQQVRGNYPNLPFILITAYTGEYLGRDADPADPVPVLSKPLNFEHLFKLISDLLLH